MKHSSSFQPPFLSILVLIVVFVASLGVAQYSEVAAAGQPEREAKTSSPSSQRSDAKQTTNQGKREDKSTSQDKREEKQSANQDKRENNQRGNPDKQPTEKDAGATNRPAQPPDAGLKDRATAPAVVSPTASPAVPRVQLSSISVVDPCRASGEVRFSAPYTGHLTLELTAHTPGESTFEPTGTTWTHDFSSEDQADFVLKSDLLGEAGSSGKDRINSFRVEVASADPPISNTTMKSESFSCASGDIDPADVGSPTVVPSVTSSPPTEVPLPSVTTQASSPTPVVQASSPTPSIQADPPASDSPTVAPTIRAASPTSISVAAPTSTVIVTPTPAPTLTPGMNQCGASITSGLSSAANPGSEAAYSHTITNLGPTPQSIQVWAASSQGWTISLSGASRATAPVPGGGMAVLDIGPLGANQSTSVVVRVSVPADARRGIQDESTVRVISSCGSGAGGANSGTDTTTVNGVISMSISTGSISFGEVSPTGVLPASRPDVSSTVFEGGAYYVKTPAVQITVNSNAAWNGEMRAGENSGTAKSIRVADGHLEWRPGPDGEWETVPLVPDQFEAGSAGTSQYSHDYRLSIRWDDDTGSFRSVVTYYAVQ